MTSPGMKSKVLSNPFCSSTSKATRFLWVLRPDLSLKNIKYSSLWIKGTWSVDGLECSECREYSVYNLNLEQFELKIQFLTAGGCSRPPKIGVLWCFAQFIQVRNPDTLKGLEIQTKRDLKFKQKGT